MKTITATSAFSIPHSGIVFLLSASLKSQSYSDKSILLRQDLGELKQSDRQARLVKSSGKQKLASIRPESFRFSFLVSTFFLIFKVQTHCVLKNCIFVNFTTARFDYGTKAAFFMSQKTE